MRKDTLIKPELGTKRVCPSCAARFYDLQKRPIECPKCSFAFEPELLLKQRRSRVPEETKPAVVAEAEEEEELETADEEAAEEPADEEELEEEEVIPEADEPLVEAGLETDEDAVAPAAGDEAVEPEEFEEDIEGEEEEDDELLEEVEEDEDDVSGIIDADIEKDEP
jgi:uncharacterized protein (TIGR02300 family)